MNKKKMFNFLSFLGGIFVVSILIGYFYHINTRGDLMPNAPLEVSDDFAKEFSRVITKNRIDPMPAAAFYDTTGHKKNWNDYEGKYLLVNFWASWCSPCVVELPSLEKLKKRFSGKEIDVIAISIDRNRSVDNIKEFLKIAALESLLYIWI